MSYFKKNLILFLLSYFLLHSGIANAVDNIAECVNQSTTISMTACYQAKYKSLSNLLTQKCKQLSELLPPKKKRELNKIQIAWQVYQSQNCELWASRYTGGTFQAVKIAICRVEMTERRLQTISAMIEEFKNR